MSSLQEQKPGLWPNLVFIGFSTLVMLVCVLAVAGKGCQGAAGVQKPKSDYVGVLRLEGIITSGGGGGGMFSEPGVGADELQRLLKDVEDDKHLKGLLIRINSPGGSAPASEEIFSALMAFKKTTKIPVLASIGDVGASGGYYIASAADKIYANKSTFTGSIGVIMPLMNYEGLLNKIGVSDSQITAGKWKDMGNPARAMGKEEKALFQTMADQVHQQFIEDVAKGRGQDVAKIKPVADGRILTGVQAREAGLVDEIGNYNDAIAAIGKLAKLGEEPPLSLLGHRGGFLEELLGGVKAPTHPLADLPTDPLSLAAATMLLANVPQGAF